MGDRDQAVVEYLTFRVPVDEQPGWLDADALHWTRFLEQQPGFLRKERWRDRDDPELVRLVIWWRTYEEWKAVPQHGLAAVAAGMATLERTPTCEAFDVLDGRGDAPS